ncbi:hypothetical protein LTR78_005959 [Recurvomyces mirabilis]|uniref:Zn(2)-C6 fungal-type domain-containing protein n=1 Tax=Recurvomyces mirabilis TaxID=574656 RepID=A0AAE0WLX1_9PEZI|nr:hypothetical protein LTR78_005959 [Recurvomyces mirabilis]KAK5155231.1 hypothetical protein LTS14_006186 [Recurvomyces mirabilis]
MPPSAKSAQGSSADVACKHCRERKIKCDRDRPKCCNCVRDGVDCGYELPGKRVNHVKLLCNNFGGLEERLVSIEGQLEQLVLHFSTTRASSRHDSLDVASYAPDDEDHLIHWDEGHSDDYRGPLCLEQLCENFRQGAYSIDWTAIGVDATATDGINDLLAQMHGYLTTEDLYVPRRIPDISLPQRHQLVRAIDQFCNRTDLVVDVFVPAHLTSHIDRIYNPPAGDPGEDDETWSIIYNAIVLLGLGADLLEASKIHLMQGLMNALLLPSTATLINARLITAPRLVNVQALILLSALTQQQDSKAKSDLLFAQACTLAKAMGLHKPHARNPNDNAQLCHERWLVCRSLYVRDRACAIGRGDAPCLPYFDVPASSGEDTPFLASQAGRIALARVQDPLYRILRSGETIPSMSPRTRGLIGKVQQDLMELARVYDIYKLKANDPDAALLQLEAFATRIAAFAESRVPSQIKVACSDARLSCLVLLLVQGSDTTKHKQQYERIVGNDRAAYPMSVADVDDQADITPVDQANTQRPHNTVRELIMLDTFPASAFMLLANRLLLGIVDDTVPDGDNVMALLRQVSAYYRADSSMLPTGSYRHTLGLVFGAVIRILDIRCVQQHQSQSPPSLSPAISHQLHVPPPAPMVAPTTAAAHSEPMNTDLAPLATWPTPISLEDPVWGDWNDMTNGGTMTDFMQFSNDPNAEQDSFESLVRTPTTYGQHCPMGTNERKRRRTVQEGRTPDGRDENRAGRGNSENADHSSDPLLYSFGQE